MATSARAIAFRQWESVGDAASQGSSARDESWRGGGGVNDGGLLWVLSYS